MNLRTPTGWTGLVAAALLVNVPAQADVPSKTIDLASTTAGVDPLARISGPGDDEGTRGVPVAGGFDCDGDGFNDFAVGHFLTDPLGRTGAGEVNLIFGNGTITDDIDLTAAHPRVLRIIGAGNLGFQEATGSEIWMGDVTGDGLGDLLICRQNYSFNPGGGNRVGAGALTIIVGGPELATLATNAQIIDLANPPGSVTIFDVFGRQDYARMGIWARVADVDGDGIDDVICAADQESGGGETHHGAVYVIRGGSHLDQTASADLGNFGSTILAGNIARIQPPNGSSHFHFGSTNQGGDLDGNGRAEVFASAALNRSGAAVGPNGTGGGSNTHATSSQSGHNGRAYIIWDDNFPNAPWPNGFTVDLQSPAGGFTTIRGDNGTENDAFGEELLGGLDYSGDGNAEFFVGDLTGDGSGGFRPQSGAGYVFYNAQNLKDMDFVQDAAAGMGIPVSKIIGPSNGAIGADTVAHGDFDGDGHDDLMFGSPTDSPLGRSSAGSLQMFYGQIGQWPSVIDTAPGAFPSQSIMRISEVLGANGGQGFSDSGDTLAYSGAAGDLDGDGRQELIVNEMRGNGASPGTIDAGNLIVLNGTFVSPDVVPFVPYCFGDGSGAPCGCANDGSSSSGCANSTGSGSSLTAAGTSSISADNMLLINTGQAANTTSLLFSGDSAIGGGSGVTFGDGLRCAGGFTQRLITTSATGFGDVTFGPGLGALGGYLAGQSRFFQVWYRDPVGSPCGSGFNLSNGMHVSFAP